MKKHLAWLGTALLLSVACTTQEIISIDLEGTIVGAIETQNEKSLQVEDAGSILVELEGSDPVISAVTDANGSFLIEDIPAGTYNLTASKEGYGTVSRQGFMLVGGELPLHASMILYEISNTTLLNLDLEPVSGNTVLLSGQINHSFTTEDFRRPYIRYFIGTTNGVSEAGYIYTNTAQVNAASGEVFSLTLNLPSSLFSSGSELYLIACGVAQYDYGYYDIASNRNIYSSLGQASDVVHVTLP